MIKPLMVVNPPGELGKPKKRVFSRERGGERPGERRKGFYGWNVVS